MKKTFRRPLKRKAREDHKDLNDTSKQSQEKGYAPQKPKSQKQADDFYAFIPPDIPYFRADDSNDAGNTSDKPKRTNKALTKPKNTGSNQRSERPQRSSFQSGGTLNENRGESSRFAPREDRSDRFRGGDRRERPQRSSFQSGGARNENRGESSRFAPREERNERSDRFRGGDRTERPQRSSFSDSSNRPLRRKPQQYQDKGYSAEGGQNYSTEKNNFRYSEEKTQKRARIRNDREGQRPAYSARNTYHESDRNSNYKDSPDKRPKYETEAGKEARATESTIIRLNRFIAASGLCARREADTMIEAGLVKVNGEVVKELGVKVNQETDKVEVNGKLIRPEKAVYILLNKPKNCITTVDDPEGRETVMEYIKGATKQRVFPVGRLDRNTTGVLLFTNDGDLAEKLTHPSNNITKVYLVRLDKALSEIDENKLRTGIILDDGPAKVDGLQFPPTQVRDEIMLEIHSGRNRLVRRMFEHLGYEVEYLDRLSFGPITKKGVPRGKWRFLLPKEVGFLKML